MNPDNINVEISFSTLEHLYAGQISYAYRLKGDKAHLLSDICMNLADAHLHRGELAHTASYYRRALFICDSLHLSEHSKFPVYCGLGQTYMDLRDFDLSNHYYELAGQFLMK